ncbi:phosphoadenylyl-sulfate reductase [Brevibacillus choshinensis]|uniref:Adenosine 5'-phosphosulfate reductase n=1 Tax=Brevibacillus choshinensis TaxID=54911 RepID=A0ABX7FKT2_BRECH|nr:phosphoadenylyl-sulfate reductase [Brevibacillus choshinensis]QRG66254.1 phosphoadenylyl-sulfate reductase [Brevibacillus choshinensis]
MSNWNYRTASDERLAVINQELGKGDTLDVIKWAYQTFQDDLVYSCSFGAEAMVLIDMISDVKKDARIVFLDTHLHFQQTYDLIERVRERYPFLNISVREPELTLAEQAAAHGDELWLRQPDLCCQIRKVEPMDQALRGAVAWMSGLRREQSPTRAQVQFVNRDEKFESLKICPLIHWKSEEVWQYIRIFELPYNTLHDQNYPSIGCAPCTRAVAPGEDSRAGRWAGHSGKTECGLHLAK